MTDIRSVREALLAQHFEDVDRLADKISDAASKIEQATVMLSATNATPGGAISAPIRPAPKQQAIGQVRRKWAAAVIAGVIISAGIGAIVGRSQPMQTPEQALSSDIGRALVRAWFKLDNATQAKIWEALDTQTRAALTYSLRDR
ncbi:hypothetical protein CBM2633_U10009 [Cupriavidus taiwanensis]|uniref:hypothetical protein n=1 Tax=Cupriavidus taiwanensis TaxID=164546 RepID=UPI000E153D6C|nr:hypothetical protein [Cupriavidus taiwanensis]SPA23665.1 hypothetical protein CBM2633_U10009 [Cupriavidus taiwanensis]